MDNLYESLDELQLLCQSKRLSLSTGNTSGFIREGHVIIAIEAIESKLNTIIKESQDKALPTIEELRDSVDTEKQFLGLIHGEAHVCNIEYCPFREGLILIRTGAGNVIELPNQLDDDYQFKYLPTGWSSDYE